MCFSSGKAEVEVASDGVGEETKHQTNHGKASVELFSPFIVSLDSITIESLFGHVHAWLGSPHVLLTLVVCRDSHEL